MVEGLVIGVVLTIVVQQIWVLTAPRVWARWITRRVPVPGPQTRFTVWTRKGERLGTIWRHHALMWFAYHSDECLVGAFGSWPEAAIHLRVLDHACHALRAEEAE
jgi:hypothetical protein